MHMKKADIPASPHSTSKFWFSRLSTHVLPPAMSLLSVPSLFVFLFLCFSLSMSLLNTLWLEISSSHQSTALSHHRHRSFYQNCEALSDMFTQLSPRACGSLLWGLRFCLGSCVLLILDFLPCCREALRRLWLCLSLQSRCIPLLLSCRSSIWGHLKPKLLSGSQSVTMKLTVGSFLIRTVSWHLGASLCVWERTAWNFVCMRKGENWKLLWGQYGASFEPCKLNIWRLWEKSLPYLATPGWWEVCYKSVFLPAGGLGHRLILLMSSLNQARAIISYSF